MIYLALIPVPYSNSAGRSVPAAGVNRGTVSALSGLELLARDGDPPTQDPLLSWSAEWSI
jgi:hypothetical protein